MPEMTLRCPRCAFEWAELEPHWDEFGSCASCGLLLSIESASLRAVTDDELEELAVEDSRRLERHAAIWVARRLHEHAQCPVCGRTRTLTMAGSAGAPDILRAWQALEHEGRPSAPLGPCAHCGAALAVTRAASGRLELAVTDATEPTKP